MPTTSERRLISLRYAGGDQPFTAAVDETGFLEGEESRVFGMLVEDGGDVHVAGSRAVSFNAERPQAVGSTSTASVSGIIVVNRSPILAVGGKGQMSTAYRPEHTITGR